MCVKKKSFLLELRLCAYVRNSTNSVEQPSPKSKTLPTSRNVGHTTQYKVQYVWGGTTDGWWRMEDARWQCQKMTDDIFVGATTCTRYLLLVGINHIAVYALSIIGYVDDTNATNNDRFVFLLSCCWCGTGEGESEGEGESGWWRRPGAQFLLTGWKKKESGNNVHPEQQRRRRQRFFTSVLLLLSSLSEMQTRRRKCLESDFDGDYFYGLDVLKRKRKGGNYDHFFTVAFLTCWHGTPEERRNVRAIVTTTTFFPRCFCCVFWSVVDVVIIIIIIRQWQ